ncbi:hypothetical protein KSP40_PGU009177 [Platanthera guangdongensis]|uniref:CCR4-NOT transcription complex subunit 11 n=1 Tax=Platanthera guangdongensis TaxID=2320717 RepID=A0ABR2M443_9ASPA
MDYGMCADTSRGAAVRDLIAKALKAPLAPAQQEQVLVELNNDPKLVYHCGLTPRKLPVFFSYQSYVINFNKYQVFHILVNMEMSLHSMEVVNRLTTAVELPTEFVHMYITNCISSCEGIKTRFRRMEKVPCRTQQRDSAGVGKVCHRPEQRDSAASDLPKPRSSKSSRKPVLSSSAYEPKL